LQRVLLFLSAVETLDRAQHDCIRKYGLAALTKIKKIVKIAYTVICPHKNIENK
jgi:hypothetical protein